MYPDGIGNNLVEFDNWTSLHLSPVGFKVGYRQEIPYKLFKLDIFEER